MYILKKQSLIRQQWRIIILTQKHSFEGIYKVTTLKSLSYHQLAKRWPQKGQKKPFLKDLVSTKGIQQPLIFFDVITCDLDALKYSVYVGAKQDSYR